MDISNLFLSLQDPHSSNQHIHIAFSSSYLIYHIDHNLFFNIHQFESYINLLFQKMEAFNFIETSSFHHRNL